MLKSQSKVVNEAKNYECFRVSLDILICIHTALLFPNYVGQPLPAAMKESSNKLLIPATVQALDKEQLKSKDTTSWPSQPCS